MMARPRKSNEELEKTGSRNVKVDQLESSEIEDAFLPPSYLDEAGKSQWRLIVPDLVRDKVARRADVPMLAAYCADLARFHNTKVDSDGNPVVDEKERSRIGARLLKVAEHFGMTPLSRQRSGINAKQKTSLVKQRG